MRMHKAASVDVNINVDMKPLQTKRDTRHRAGLGQTHERPYALRVGLGHRSEYVQEEGSAGTGSMMAPSTTHCVSTQSRFFPTTTTSEYTLCFSFSSGFVSPSPSTKS